MHTDKNADQHTEVPYLEPADRDVDASYASQTVCGSLRREGFVLLPSLWVKREDIPKIHKIAHVHADAVNEIRAKVRKQRTHSNEGYSYSQVDPKQSKDAAWDAYRKLSHD